MSRTAAFWIGFTFGRYAARLVDALVELAQAHAGDVDGDVERPRPWTVDRAGDVERAE